MKKILNVDEGKISFLRFKKVIGGFPDFSKEKMSRSEILNRLTWISGMFCENGKYDFSNKDIEEYALCLDQDGLSDEAYTILKFIIKGKNSDVLFISNDERYPFSPLARQNGKLGYESLFLYAKLSLERDIIKAIPVFAELVNKIPTKCYPVRVQDIRVAAISHLIKIQSSGKFTKELGQYIQIDLKQELLVAKEHQY